MKYADFRRSHKQKHKKKHFSIVLYELNQHQILLFRMVSSRLFSTEPALKGEPVEHEFQEHIRFIY